MTSRNEEHFTPDELRQIGAGIALFVGSLTLAALLKPLAPWSRPPKERASNRRDPSHPTIHKDHNDEAAP
ncbi:MAG TPA: hypothetical protein VF707_10795 [Ardenticatenaceae bacterium]|jgi:hypothetical protein